MSDTSPSKPFRVAFVGAGGIAHHHMKLLKQIPGVEIVAAADVSDAALIKARNDFGIERAFKDYRVMLKEVAEIDAADICTPNSLHARHAIDCLEAGKHVLVEKPMAMNASEAAEMVSAAERTRKQLIVGFQYRFDAKSKMIRDRVAAGEFGKIFYVRARWLRRRGIPSWGVFGRKDLQGGGPLIDLGVHMIEATHDMIGSPRPVSATGGIFTSIGNRPPAAAAEWGPWDHQTYSVEDLAIGTIRFETGALMTVETSFAAHVEEDELDITLVGEKAGAAWKASKVFKDEAGYMTTSHATYLGNWDAFEYKMRHFVEVCRDGRTSEIPVRHALDVQKMVDAIYASAAKGREVTIE